jgi:glucose dehydrogenase
MTKELTKNLTSEFRKSMKKALSNASIRAIALSILFIVSGIGASVLTNPAAAAPNTAAPSAAAPAATQPALTQAEANWAYPNGNAFGQDYNPQTQINSSNIQYLGLAWIYPLPAEPTSLSTLTSLQTPSTGVDPLIVNGTAIVMVQYDTVLAFNLANGDVLWTFLSPLVANETLPSGVPGVSAHAHDGSEEFTTATFASGVSGPTFWFQGGNVRVYALDAINGHEELNFSDYTGLNMAAGNNPVSYYSSLPASNIVIDPQTGILVNSIGNGFADNTGRSFFVGWNLNTNPPTMKWITYGTPPQPGSNVPLNPYYDIQMIANMTGAETFYPGVDSTNGYTTPAEVAGGVLMNVNDDIVVNWKTMSPSLLNTTLYNDWGYADQSQQCLAITGGDSTGSTNAGWGGQWLLGSGQSTGLVFVNTNNKDPYGTPCTPGPDLWSASELALNDSTGQLVWGFQANAHDNWDYDCSWSQELANETINSVNTEVLLKTCKNGYLYELNAVTGNLIWAWSPPSGVYTPGAARCPVCYMLNPLNRTQMISDFPDALTNCAPTFATACLLGPQPPSLWWPSEIAGFEDEQAYDPATNQIYATSHIVPYFQGYLPANASDYLAGGGPGVISLPCATCGTIANNATVWDINASNGQIVWHYDGAPLSFQGFRGQTDVSGNIVYLTMSSGDVVMLNAQTGQLVRDYYLGAPMDVGVSIGASISGQEYILTPVGTCSLEAVATCPGSTPGDIVALTLTTPPPSSVTVSTSTVTSTTISTTTSVSVSTTTASGAVVTSTGSVTTVTATTGVSSTTLYGVAAVAVIFIIATGYLAMTRSRKPPS